ncbi:hypothetical protein [Halarchaeum salinum]|uniref:Uncharacterized protein n=1 Tax=Halarchaeum salinum TaxID=489912 RepID=A0AAV3S731_9EURY
MSSQDPDPFSIESDVERWQVVAGAVVAVVLGILNFPAVHGALYGLFVGTPALLQWAAVALVVGAIGYRRRSRPLVMAAVAVFVVLGLFAGPIVGGIYAHEDVADSMGNEATQLDTLPNTSTENVRMLPRSVADNYAQSSMQYPQYRLTGSDITYRNGTYEWSYGIVPDAFLVSVLGNQRGAMYVNMTTTNKDIATEETRFTNGRGQLFFDSYRYQSVLSAPLERHAWDTTFNARANGTSYIAHATTTYEWKVRLFPLPQLYAVPQFGGVEVMRPSGSISHLSPEQADESALLRGQNVYPYSLTTYRVQSMQYVHGALNKWFWKEDVLKVATLPEGGNEWPLVVPTDTDNGLTYFVATEPTGSGNGVYQIWTFDGQTGDVGVQQYDDAQIGPQRAIDFVSRNPEVNRLSNAQAVSPIPIVKDDALYWHVKVVPRSDSGVTYTAFVNAGTGDVTILEGDDPVYAFLTKAEVAAIENETSGQSGPSASDTTVRVVVTDANGTITGTQNITVPEGGDVQVTVANDAPGSASADGNATATRSG